MKRLASSLSALLVFLLYSTPSVAADVTVRACAYVPAVSVPAAMPPDGVDLSTPDPLPTATLPAPTGADPKTITRQLRVYTGLWQAVNDHYVYRDFGGHDWKAIGARYQALIRQGLSDDHFYAAMQAMLAELGDNHSYFQNPAEVAAEQAEQARGEDFVGIGALFLPVQGTDSATIITVFPDSPAAAAGLRSHDSLLRVDGGPVQDAYGTSRTRGPDGTPVTVTIRRPGTAAHDVTLMRRRVTGALPIDFCLLPGTRLGYLFLPTFLEPSVPDQVRVALRAMTVGGPLDGLIIDNRMNGGGSGDVAEALMGLFTHGSPGSYLSRQGRKPLTLTAEDVGGSQTVPLIVLVDVNTVSYAEIFSGVLRLSGRARIVGGPTLGNVEQLWKYDFQDGSRAWLASATFQPSGEANGIWEQTGIVPDVLVPTRWNLFTEANDPALAKAVDLLMQH